jgi:diacylglycerol kinase (ATP)
VASPFGSLVVIANPRAGRGQVGRELPEVERALLSRGLEHRIVETERPGDAAHLAREALGAGERFLVAVGGDGTVADVVNGMLEDDLPVDRDAVLGVVAASSGCDFVRTFGLPGDSVRATATLTGENLFPIDVAKATFRTAGGGTASRYYPGVAEVGLGGAAVSRAERLPRALGRARYFLGFWAALARSRPRAVRVRVGDQEYEGPALGVVVANCQYYGGGMRLSPRSWPGDGLLEVLVMKGPRSDAFTRLPRVFQGDWLPDPNVVEMKGRRVRVECEAPLPVQADGDPLGTTPASFDLIRLPIRLKV